MAEPTEEREDVDLLIDEYLDGRMDSEDRARFEDRINKEPELRNRVNSATRSVDLVQKALGWVTPGEDFDEKVNTKIVSITQSGQNLQPYLGSSGRSLTPEDPDAKLLADPEAARERKRLLILAIIAGLLFALAAAAIGYSIATGFQQPAPLVPERKERGGR